MIRRRLAVIIAGLCFTFPVYGQEALTPTALEGAWILQSLTMDGEEVPATGYMFFSGRHYSFITNMYRPSLTRESGRRPLEELRESEKDLFVEAFRSLTAAAGLYIIEGEEIAYVMEVVRSPYLKGATSSKRKSWLQGNRLIQDFQGGEHHRVMIWQKVREDQQDTEE